MGDIKDCTLKIDDAAPADLNKAGGDEESESEGHGGYLDEPEYTDENEAADFVTDAAPQGRYDKAWLTPERVQQIRTFTPQLLDRLRRSKQVRAEAKINPILHGEGHKFVNLDQFMGPFLENLRSFQESPEFKKLSDAKKNRALHEFKKKHIASNPSWHQDFKTAVDSANESFLAARKAARREQDERMKHLVTSTASAAPETYSKEIGAQMAGGVAGGDDEGTQAAIASDPAVNFAAQNKEFIDEQRKKLESKGAFAPSEGEPVEDPKNPEYKFKDVEALKDPKNKELWNGFVSNHWPIVRGVVKRLLDSKGIPPEKVHPDDLAQEAGLAGLTQAIHDWNPAMAKFTNHASNKIRGVANSFLQNQDTAIGVNVRRKAKQFKEEKAAEATPAIPPAPSTSAPSIAAPPAPSTSAPARPNREQIKQIIIRRATKDGAEERIKNIDAAKLAQGHKKPEGSE